MISNCGLVSRLISRLHSSRLKLQNLQCQHMSGGPKAQNLESVAGQHNLKEAENI